jgi:ABC-2 type transport system permease protein
MPETAFVDVKDKGWLTGFSNMFANENGRWWRTEKWIIQLTAWIVLLDLTMAFLLYVRPYITGEAGDPGLVPSNVRMVSGLFFSLAGIYLPFGIAIMTHDTIIRERELGTMAWVLSKPLSRISFALSKVVANTIGVMVLMVLVPGIIAYGLISLYNGSFINATNFFGALGILALLCMFYISLVFMLGSITKSRYAVLGVTALYILMSLGAAEQMQKIGVYLSWRLSYTAADLSAFGTLASDAATQFIAAGVLIVAMLAVAFAYIERIEI